MNSIKIILIFLFLLLYRLISFSQIVDGPANFRDKPNGKLLFQLQNNVQISLGDSTNGWYRCVFSGYVEIPQKITDITLIPKGTKLFSKDLKLAGEVLYPIKYQFKEQIFKQKYALIEVAAYTFTKNIILKTKDINTDKLIWKDSDISDFKYYEGNEDNASFSMSNTTNYHEIYLDYNGVFEDCLVKEHKIQKKIQGIDIIESKIKLEFYPYYMKGDYKIKRVIDIEANNVYFSDNFFVSEILGCCDNTDKFIIYSYNTLKPNLLCENKIFTYNANKMTYILGFKESDYNKERIIGKWFITDLSKNTDSLTVIAKDSNIYDMSLHVILPNKFYYNDNVSYSYRYNCIEEVNVFDNNSPSEIYLYMQSPDNNDSIKKSKISIINNRFSTKYKNKTFILGED